MKECIAYTLSLSFQLSGAVLLLIYAFSTKRNSIINSFFKNSFSSFDRESKTLHYNHDVFVQEFIITYSNKIAVFFLVIGYIGSIWGNPNGQSKWMITGITLVITFAIIMITVVCVRLIIPKLPKVRQIVTMEELIHIDINPNMETLSKNDLDEMMAMTPEEAKKRLRENGWEVD